MADKFYGGVVAGLTDYSLDVILRSTADNTLVTGVAAASVTAYYYRQGAAAPVQITVSALGAADAAHSDGGWREIHATNLAGRYRFDVPDAVFAAGADWAGVQLRVTNTFGFDGHFDLQSAALIADQLLKRDFAAVTGEASRSMLNALRFLRNRWVATPAGALSVKKEDDSAEAWSAAIATTVGAAPITSIDPN